MTKLACVLAITVACLLPACGVSVGAQQRDQDSKTLSPASAAPPGVTILSPTSGVDFSGFLKDWDRITGDEWQELMPADAKPPQLQRGTVHIRFKLLPNGKLQKGSMILEGSSGYVALDRAAWSALVNSRYPPLPSEFHEPYLELRAAFAYNEPKPHE